MNYFKTTKQFLLVHFLGLSEYRGDVLVYVLSSFILPLILMNVWLTIADSRASSVDEKIYLVQYFFLQMVISVFNGAWHGMFMGEDIKYGRISQFIVKPTSFFLYEITQNISEKGWKILLSLPILALLYVVYSNYLIFSIELSFVPIVIFVIVFSFLINFLLEHIVGLSAFWLSSTRSIGNYNEILLYLTSGRLYPLQYIKNPFIISFINFLPYQYIISFPVNTILQKLTLLDIYKGIGMQLIWISVLFLIYRFLWYKGLKIYDAQGS